jgi:hypothetical protein
VLVSELQAGDHFSRRRPASIVCDCGQAIEIPAAQFAERLFAEDLMPTDSDPIACSLRIMEEAVRAGKIQATDLEHFKARLANLESENAALRARLNKGPDLEDNDSPRVAGRFLFLYALRDLWPHFWRSLNLGVWKKRCDLSTWAETVRVRDDWIILDAALPTLRFWTANPNSPDAQLEKNHVWFRYFPSEVPARFQPKFSGSWPELPQDGIEPIDDFLLRRDEEYREYRRQWRNRFLDVSGQGSRKLKMHARWTALRFAGESVSSIADHWHWERELEDPEGTIRRQTDRFMKSIGLTAPWRER